jgi:hypothetical protein
VRSALPNRYSPEAAPSHEQGETHDDDVQRNDVGFAAHDVKRDRQSHDDGQSDSRERR